VNLNQLRIFYMTAKHGSLSLAAEKLFITQPAVTKGIQRLQEYYEIKFVNRFGKKMVLTDAGEALYSIAEKIFEMENQAEESIQDFQQHKKGHIRIHASESFGCYYLPHIMVPFHKASPNIRLSVNILPTHMVVENTAGLNNDIGFISYPIENDKIEIKEILEDTLVLIVSAKHPFAGEKCLRPKQLEGQSMIVHETGSATQRIIDAFIKRNNLAIDVALEISSNRGIMKAVEGGLGISLISRKVGDEEVRSGKLVAIPFADESIKRKYYLVYHKDKYISETLQRLMDEVERWASEYRQHLSIHS